MARCMFVAALLVLVVTPAALAADTDTLDVLAGHTANPSLLISGAPFTATVPKKALCKWPGLELYLFKADANFTGEPSGDCSDPRIRPEDLPACKRCARQPTRGKCLATTGRVWFGADVESCIWVAPLAGKEVVVREQKQSVGINYAYYLQSRLGANVCTVKFDYTFHTKAGIYDPVDFGTTASFVGGDMSKPWGLLPISSCTLAGSGSNKCSYTFYSNSDGLAWLNIGRGIYTDNPRILRELEKTPYNCTSTGGICASAKPPARYTMRWTERLCKGGGEPSKKVKTVDTKPVGYPQLLLFPGGASPSFRRELVYGLVGLSRGHWTVKADRPMLVMRLPRDVAYGVCMDVRDATECDYWAVRNEALGVPACYAKVCSGAFSKPVDSDEVLVVTYKKFQTNDYLYVNTTETPETVARVELSGLP